MRDLDFVDPVHFTKKLAVAGNCALLMIQGESATARSRTYFDLIATAIEDPFYSQLRTEQQTGYIVSSSPKEIRDRLFMTFAVQSGSHCPRDLLARFELFIEGFVREAQLETFRERFEGLKKAQLERRSAPFKNLNEEAGYLEYVAENRNFDFEWKPKVSPNFVVIVFSVVFFFFLISKTQEPPLPLAPCCHRVCYI